MRKRRSVRPPRAVFHVGELIPQRGNPAFGERVRNRCHKRVRHPSPCAMRHDVAGDGVLGNVQQARNGVDVVYIKPDSV